MYRSRSALYWLIASPLLAISVHGLSAQVDGVKILRNRSIAASVSMKSGHLSIVSVTGLATKAQLHPDEAFVLALQDGRELRSSAMQIVGGLKISTQSRIQLHRVRQTGRQQASCVLTFRICRARRRFTGVWYRAEISPICVRRSRFAPTNSHCRSRMCRCFTSMMLRLMLWARCLDLQS